MVDAFVIGHSIVASPPIGEFVLKLHEYRDNSLIKVVWVISPQKTRLLHNVS